MVKIDGQTAAEEGLPVVFVADVRPFQGRQSDSGYNPWFCVLHPLMSLDGDRLDATRSSFPNRCCVWWMLRDELVKQKNTIVPGALLVGRLEEAPKFRTDKPDADRFQAKRDDIQLAFHTDLVEVLPLTTPEPSLELLYRGKRLDWNRPSTGRVFLRGSRFTLGPVRATWDAERGSLGFQPLLAGNPEVLRLPTPVFDQLVRQEKFDVQVGTGDTTAQVVSLGLRLTRTKWFDDEALRQAGEMLDVSNDAQVLNWALKYYKIAQAEALPVRKFFAGLPDEQLPGDAQLSAKLQRLSEMRRDAERVLDLGEAVARDLADVPAYGELIKQHLGVVANDRIEQIIAARQQEIAERTAAAERQLEAAQARLEGLATEFQQKLVEQDKALGARDAQRIAELEQRDLHAAMRERAVAEQEETLQHRLERVIEQYRTEAERIGDTLVAQFPLWRRLGAAGGGDGSSDGRPDPFEPADLKLPYYLETPRSVPADTGLDEPAFMAQFRGLVEGRGFVFLEDDLTNYHLCMKIGGLTVLAGPSGTGKSTLPQLYAEAMGWIDRYLHVPVRPDWLDDRDFLGAYNALARRFEPASSGVADHLIAAAEAARRNLGDLYTICLDEMNLARVEHYFAQFLSVLERPVEKRRIALFAPGLARRADPYGPYQSIPVGENIRFVGTVNIDETTHFFSPKVLDRAQIVSFGPPDLAGTPELGERRVPPIVPVSLETYQSWVKPIEPNGAARQFLLQIESTLRQARLSLGRRQFDRMLRYLASSRDLLPEDKALDFQIVQVVLPRVRLTSPGVEDMLRELQRLLTPDRFPRSAAILERMTAPGVENDFFQLL